MNRFKKELDKRGFYTEDKYDYIPYPISANGVMLLGVHVDAETASYTLYADVATEELYFDRQMNTHRKEN